MSPNFTKKSAKSGFTYFEYVQQKVYDAYSFDISLDILEFDSFSP